MKELSEYLKDENIEFYLYRMRAKLAKQRNKKHLMHLLSNARRYNYHLKAMLPSETELQNMLPRRKQWKKLGSKNRYQNGVANRGQAINSIEKSIKSLKFTIDFYRRTSHPAAWLSNLDQFVLKVQNSFSDPDYAIITPETYPKPKDESKAGPKTICRPISLFSLRDKIVISLANKFLTDHFDAYMYQNSLAFRGKRLIGGKYYLPTHHDSIKQILQYKKSYTGRHLWVAECDMMKFYDTVNHSVIRKSFAKFMRRVGKQNPNTSYEQVKRVFNSYLNSYAFNKNVFPLNNDPSYFAKYQIKDGEFGWVHKELLDSGYYKTITRSRIGIPQGGALSGLISNIVLDFADKELQKLKDKDLLYIRYCDDMIIMHPNKNKCLNALKIYNQALKKLKLLPHKATAISGQAKEFWKAKSKKPYRWDMENKNGKRWVGFVGYEISCDGNVRVRKSSLKKEMKKQFDLVFEMIHAVANNKKIARNKKIEESIINRLIGMSVGKVKLHNAQSLKNEMCWVNGFSEINNNRHTRTQLKRLDASRNKLVRKLHKILEDQGNLEPKDVHATRDLIYYGKPFSYYYQALKTKPFST